jgi:hypothetical protein
MCIKRNISSITFKKRDNGPEKEGSVSVVGI